MVSEEKDIINVFATLCAHQNILHKLKDFENDCPENYSMDRYDVGYLKGVRKCIELVSESMGESI